MLNIKHNDHSDSDNRKDSLDMVYNNNDVTAPTTWSNVCVDLAPITAFTVLNGRLLQLAIVVWKKECLRASQFDWKFFLLKTLC